MTHRKLIRIAVTSLAALILGGCFAADTSETENETENETTTVEPRQRRPHTSRQHDWAQQDREHAGVIGTPASATPVDVADEGRLCIYANEAPPHAYWAEPTTLVSGDQVVVQVTLPGCLSASCDVAREASCDVQVEGNRLVVEATFSYVSLEQEFCTLDCGSLTATCSSPPLDEGDYEIVFADRVAPLAVPSTGDACLIDTELACTSDAECLDGFCAEPVDGEPSCSPDA